MSRVIGKEPFYNGSGKIVGHRLEYEKNRIDIVYFKEHFLELTGKKKIYLPLNSSYLNIKGELEELKSTLVLKIMSELTDINLIKSFKNSGFKIVLKYNPDKFSKLSDSDFDKLVELSSEIHISCLDFDTLEIIDIIDTYENKLIAICDTSDRNIFLKFKKYQRVIFHGDFFLDPEFTPDKKISSNTINVLEIVQMLTKDPHISFMKVESKIKESPEVVFNLFKFLNKAEFSFRSKIVSIQQAISLVGLKRLEQILRIFLGALEENNYNSYIVAEKATIRGNIMDYLCEELSVVDYEYSYIVGIFSLMDSLFGITLEDLFESIELDSKIVNGLIDPKSELYKILALSERLETFSEADILEVHNYTGLSMDKLYYILSRSVLKENV